MHVTPTAVELEILKLLWQRPQLAGRELHDALEPVLQWGYSSTRKTLERMAEKGLVRVESNGVKNFYSANVGKVPTLAALAADFSKRVLGLDAPLPIAMFADSRFLQGQELAELEQHLSTLAAAVGQTGVASVAPQAPADLAPAPVSHETANQTTAHDSKLHKETRE